MPDAQRVVTEIHRILEGPERDIRRHPYPDAVASGEITLDGLRAFPGHQHHVVTSDLRAFALLVQRFGHTSARDFFAGVLQRELAALDNVQKLGQRIGMDPADLHTYEVTPDGVAYAAYVTWQSAYASAAEVTCGLLVNFDAWGFNCGRLSRALKERHGFTKSDSAFLGAFAQMPSFESATLEIIRAGLDDGVEPRLIERGSRLIQAYEKMFWDAMHRVGRSANRQ